MPALGNANRIVALSDKQARQWGHANRSFPELDGGLKSLRENSHLPASVPQGRMKLPRTTPIRATLFGCFSSNSPQNCHPERSASQILSRDTALVGAQSKDLGDAHLTNAARTFSTTEARGRDLRNVDVAYGTQRFLFSAPGKRPWRSPWMRASAVEKLGAAGPR